MKKVIFKKVEMDKTESKMLSACDFQQRQFLKDW